MEVQCPNCLSRFFLPDSMVSTGRKLRCSVCSNVFMLQVEEAKQEPSKLELSPSVNKKKSKKIPLLMGALVFLLCIVGALAWEFLSKEKETVGLEDATVADKVKLLTMRNVRQYMVDNEKVGKVFVIEGRVVNEFREPKELIAVEAAIYGSDKRVIASKKQRCGTQLSLFQLQVLSEKEMEAYLNNKVEILTNNINIKQGGEVPFMVLFYAPPDDVAEFGVKIIDVRDTPNTR